MIDQPHPPEGLEIVEVRVYYDPASGEVVHVYQLATPAGDEPLSEARIADEMAAFETSVRERHGRDLERLRVDAAELQRATQTGARLSVDVERKQLVVDTER